MATLSYFCGRRSTPNTWQPAHVDEIISFLKSRGYSYELYKERDKSKYILVNKNAFVFYPKCSDLCEALINLYFEEKQQEENEFMRQRIERAKKNGVMLSAVYCKWLLIFL